MVSIAPSTPPVPPVMVENQRWLEGLTGDGRDAEAQQQQLRRFLQRGLLKALSRRGVDADQVEDFVQEAMLRILDKLHTFRGDSRFTTWAMAIATRLAFDDLRRARYTDRSLDALIGDGEVELPQHPTTPEVEHTLQQQAVLAAMDRVIREQLTDRQQQVLRAELEGIPKAVLERRLGINRNALYKLTHDARQRLQQGLYASGLSEAEVRAAFTP